jgi:hypothetical protein
MNVMLRRASEPKSLSLSEAKESATPELRILRFAQDDNSRRLT